MLLTFSHNLHPGIVLGLWSQMALLLLCSAASPFEKRKISGQNPWAKPARFQMSSVIFLVTTSVLLSQLQAINQYPGAGHHWQGVANAIGWTMGIAMTVGNILIALQALNRTRTSARP